MASLASSAPKFGKCRHTVFKHRTRQGRRRISLYYFIVSPSTPTPLPFLEFVAIDIIFDYIKYKD